MPHTPTPHQVLVSSAPIYMEDVTTNRLLLRSGRAPHLGKDEDQTFSVDRDQILLLAEQTVRSLYTDLSDKHFLSHVAAL